MDTEALLNPADESLIINETTDEEICWALLDAIKAWEEGLINDDIDDDAHPVARKLEEALASFRCQMQLEMSYSMQSTYLTDYLKLSSLIIFK